MKIKKVGEVDFDDVSGESGEDLRMSISSLTKEDEDEVQVALENGTVFPLVLVSPVDLLKNTKGRAVSDSVVEEYAEEWSSGANFPPVIINSLSKKDALIEGGHRTVSAVKAGVGAIRAIDLAGIRVVKVDGVEVYDFKRARR